MKRILLLLASFFAVTAVSAQVSLDVEYPAVVSLDEPFKVAFVANGDVDDFEYPSFEGFDVLVGPSLSTSRSVSIINGKTKSEYVKSYVFVLKPVKAGKFTVGSATARYKKKEIVSDPFTVEVVDESGSVSSSSASGGVTSGNTDVNKSSVKEDIYLKMSVPKRNLVKGEPVEAVIELYTKVPIYSFREWKFPDFNGFWSQEVESPQNLNFERRNVDGKLYNVALLRRFMLIPQKSGELTVDPATLVAEIQGRNSSSRRSFFDEFYGTYETEPVRLVSERIKFNVSDLPSGAPASFGGAVGSFTVSASLDADSLKVHQASSLKVLVSGRGNVSLVNAPKVNFPADFEVYDVKTEDRTSSGSGGTSGGKLFEVPFIPRAPGDYTVPPVKFTYYDVSSGSYRTLSTEPMKVHVSGDGGRSGEFSSGNVQGFVNRQAVQVLGKDIRYVKGNTVLKEGVPFFVVSPVFCLLVILTAVAAAVCVFSVRRYRKANGDVVAVRSRRANRIAGRRLKGAAGLLAQKKRAEFYEEVHRAVTGYLSDRLSLTSSEMNRETISSALADRKVDASLVERLGALLDSCEFARYAPESSSGDMERDYREAVDLISKIEDNIR